ncbi:MAG: methyltransferase domain-containing protein [Actinomycetota bacterium]|nr:methyltransferase domain-containing protein [Actinomycetota bacterium]
MTDTSGRRYTHGHHESVLQSHRWRTAANSCAYLIPHLVPGQRVLDVGCGPGTITAGLASLVAPGTVVGVDAAGGILAEARATVAAQGAETVLIEQADVLALPYEDGSFDVVHAHQVLQHLADPVAALREMRRVCRAGGVVAARDGDYGGFLWTPPDPVLDRWLELYLTVARTDGGEPRGGRWLVPWAREAGFSEITASASSWVYASAEERRWWGASWSERVTRSAFADGARSQGGATDAELAAMADAWLRWARSDTGWITIPHGEIVCRP